MVGSIDPRCETVRGTHWPKPGRVVVWSSRRGNHLGQRFKPTASKGRTYGCKRSDQAVKKLLCHGGPSTYGSRLKAGTTAIVGFDFQTARYASAVSRRDTPELCTKPHPSKQRAWGMPGARCTRSLVCKVLVAHECSHHRSTGTPGIPARNGFNGFLRALPGDRAC